MSSSSVLQAALPNAAAFSLLGWLPWGNKQPALQEADYSAKASAQGPIPGARLKDVQVLFRHGARTPVTPDDKFWKNTNWDVCGNKLESLLMSLRKGSDKKLPFPDLDVYDKDTLKPEEKCIDQAWDLKVMQGGCSKGELTKLGQQQAVSLGTWLRHRYLGAAALLPDDYSKETVIAHSTNYRRTRGTMHGVLLGLFPSYTENFSVATSAHDDELMLIQVSTCERLAAWYTPNKKRIRDSDETDPELLNAQAHMLEVLGYTKKTNTEGHGEDGSNTVNKIHFGELNDALTSMRAHKKKIDPNLTALDLDLVNRIATERVNSYVSAQADPEPLSLGMGRLLGVMSGRMHAAAACDSTSTPKLSLWCGHDTTLMPLMIMLGNRCQRWPPYASSVVLELWEDTSESAASLPLEERHYVRALFNGQELTVRTPARTVNSESCASGDGSRNLPKLLSLKEFKAEILDKYAKTSAEYSSSCAQGSGFWQFLKSISGGNGTKEDTSKY